MLSDGEHRTYMQVIGIARYIADTEKIPDRVYYISPSSIMLYDTRYDTSVNLRHVIMKRCTSSSDTLQETTTYQLCIRQML